MSTYQPRPWPQFAEAMRMDSIELTTSAQQKLREARRIQRERPEHAETLIVEAELDMERTIRKLEQARGKS